MSPEMMGSSMMVEIQPKDQGKENQHNCDRRD